MSRQTDEYLKKIRLFANARKTEKNTINNVYHFKISGWIAHFKLFYKMLFLLKKIPETKIKKAGIVFFAFISCLLKPLLQVFKRTVKLKGTYYLVDETHLVIDEDLRHEFILKLFFIPVFYFERAATRADLVKHNILS